jgi:2-oxoglutarate dehydrogenase E1 component
MDLQHLQALANQINQPPEGVPLNRQVKKILEDRRKMAGGALAVNWGFAETLAYASLLEAGYPVRLTGQDVGRGTFSHRHAVLHNQKDGSIYIPLQRISKDQAVFDIYDSLLSEEAVLAFEYGYATTSPTGLVIWEAQFGDFANGAQVVIDQFITSGEHKWQRLCGLTLLLPHGYEGQGPEHSSARLERFLQLSAEHNIQVTLPTTPAQIFHLLRRQAIRPLRRPLIVMSPKSLLRHKQATSSLEELANGEFRLVLGETEAQDPLAVTRVIICSGKVYYDLRDARRERGLEDVAIIRLETIYPFPEKELMDELRKYPNLTDAVWCQEEPMNQGAWYSSQHHMRRVLFSHKPEVYLRYAGRDASAAPAAGYMSLHIQQQEAFINEALAKQE